MNCHRCSWTEGDEIVSTAGAGKRAAPVVIGVAIGLRTLSLEYLRVLRRPAGFW